MSHARVEELSDSDSDPSIDDPSSFSPPPSSILRPSQVAPPTSSNPQYLQPQSGASRQPSSADTAKHKRYQCLYPIYFDSSRTLSQGRRVSSSAAVPNPLARTIVDAVASLGLDTVFEPGTMHPKDWGNPGRVRVLLRHPNGKMSRSTKKINNKHHLYLHVSEYLKQHPTTETSPLRLQIAGMPPPKEGKVTRPNVPRGWKVNEILPLHSPALSGGGVSENMLRDMMGQMGGPGGGGLPPGMEGMQQMLGAMGGVGGGGGGGGGEASGGGKKKGKGKKG